MPQLNAYQRYLAARQAKEVAVPVEPVTQQPAEPVVEPAVVETTFEDSAQEDFIPQESVGTEAEPEAETKVPAEEEIEITGPATAAERRSRRRN